MLFNRKNSLLVLLVFFILLPGCIREDLDNCEQYSLILKAVDDQGKDISASGMIHSAEVYVFDQGFFVKKIIADLDKPMMLGYEKNHKLTFVAWANLENDMMQLPTLTSKVSVGDALIKLRSFDDYHCSPSDLFYASDSISGRREENKPIKLVLKRYTTSVKLTAKNVVKYFNRGDQGFRYVVRGAEDGLNFLGESIGKGVSYSPETYFDKKNELVSPIFNILPSCKKIAVDIYQNTELLFTITSDMDGNPLIAIPGKQLDIVADFTYAMIKITVTVAPWDEIQQDVDL